MRFRRMSPTSSKNVKSSISNTKPVSTSRNTLSNSRTTYSSTMLGDAAGTLSPTARHHPQRYANEHQHQAGGGIRKTAVQFDEEAPALGPVNPVQQQPCGHGVHRCVHAPQVNIALRIQRQRQVGTG